MKKLKIPNKALDWKRIKIILDKQIGRYYIQIIKYKYIGEK